MFQSLSDRLSQTLRNITGKAVLSEDNIQETLREVRMALLEADVALPVVKDFVEAVKQRALGREVSRSLSPGQAFLRIVQADVMSLPFADGAFDYALTAMFLHHLDDDAIVHVLRELDRISRRGVIVADLLRHRRAYAWISLFTVFANPMVKHDARVSVAQAFTKQDVLALRDRAGLSYANYYRHFGH